MKETKLLGMATLFALMALIPMAHALESDNVYLLDDSESVSIVISVDTEGNALFEEVFVTVDPGVEEYVMDVNTVQIQRISDDETYGKFFGKTLNGHSIIVIYSIDGERVKLMSKIWTDNGVQRIVSSGEIIKFF